MAEPLSELATEKARAGREDLDTRPTRELVDMMNDEDADVAAAVRAAARPLTAAIDAIAERLAAGGRLVYVGAGTAGRIAALDAIECGPTFGIEPAPAGAVSCT